VNFLPAERLNPTMPLLTIADSFYIGVLDVALATSWYIEKLGLQKAPAELDDPQGCVALGFSKKGQTSIAVLGPQGKPTHGTTPMLYASNIQKARQVLGSRGVNVGEVLKDRQGTHYFEMRDLEGNVIEVSEEP
jgi:hypothetical protein